MSSAKESSRGNSNYSISLEDTVSGDAHQNDGAPSSPTTSSPGSQAQSSFEVQESILLSVKDALGLVPAYDPFDNAIIMHINSVFGILFQLGIGPESQQFTITGSGEKWSDFISEQIAIEFVRSYMYLKVRLLFDPPTTATLYDAFGNQVREMEWRLRVAGDEYRLNALGRDDLNDWG